MNSLYLKNLLFSLSVFGGRGIGAEMTEREIRTLYRKHGDQHGTRCPERRIHGAEQQRGRTRLGYPLDILGFRREAATSATV